MSQTGTRRGENGATLLEFAVILPVFLFLAVGIIDFGRAMYAYHFVSFEARQASRWASVRGVGCNTNYITPCPAQISDILSFVQNNAPPGLYVTGNAGCSSSTVGCLTINQTSNFVWPGTTTTDGSSTASCTDGGAYAVNSPGCVVQVQVTYTWSSGIPLIPYTLVLASTSEYVISN